MIPTLVQSTGGCPQTCVGGQPVDSAACSSRTGSGNLRGWTNFTADVSDWNSIKFTRRDSSGDVSSCIGGPDTCAEPLLVIRQYRRVFGGYALWNVATNSQDNSNLSGNFYKYDQDVDEFDAPECGGATSNGTSPTSITGSPVTGCGSLEYYALPQDQAIFGDFADSNSYELAHPMRSGSVTKTSKSYSGLGCCNIQFECDGIDVEAVKTVGSATVSYSIPDTIDAALARGTSTPGSLCETTPGTIGGSGGATSTTQIAFSGTTSVKVTFGLSGLTIGIDYEITVPLTRTAVVGGAVSSATGSTVFTATSTSESVDYHVPIDPTYKYKYEHATAPATFAPA